MRTQPGKCQRYCSTVGRGSTVPVNKVNHYLMNSITRLMPSTAKLCTSQITATLHSRLPSQVGQTRPNQALERPFTHLPTPRWQVTDNQSLSDMTLIQSIQPGLGIPAEVCMIKIRVSRMLILRLTFTIATPIDIRRHYSIQDHSMINKSDIAISSSAAATWINGTQPAMIEHRRSSGQYFPFREAW